MNATAKPPRLPEDAQFLERYRAALKGNERAVVDAMERTRESLAKEDLILLENPGVPLRPLFIPQARLDALCAVIHRQTLALGKALDARCDEPALEDDLPIPRAFWEHVDAHAAFRHPDFGLVLRPDGFLFEDRFLLSEPNMANGYLISGTYPDAVHAVFANCPVLSGVFDVQKNVVRPLDRIRAMLKSRVPAGVNRPRIALFWHHEEHAIIKDWNERTQAVLRYVPRMLEKDGFDVVFAHEDDLSVDKSGQCVFVPDGKPVHLVFQIPIGTFFLYDPPRLTGDLAHLRGTHVGNAPFLQPLAHLAIDKGTMPWWHMLPGWPQRAGDLGVDLIPTHYPKAERAREYRLERQRWVLKRSFEGKDTHAGISAPGRAWNRALDTAVKTCEYVMQPYVQMSVAEIPVVKGGRIEWVDSSVELSLFIIGGKYAGAFARFMPYAEGHVLSPPPPGMGFTLVHGT